MTSKEIFLDKISELIQNSIDFKLTLSKPKHSGVALKNVYIKPVLIKNIIHYAVTHRYPTKDEVKNYIGTEMVNYLELLISESLLNAELFCNDNIWRLFTNNKGKSTLIKDKHLQPKPIDLDHDKSKRRLIPSTSKWLVPLGLASAQGYIFDKAQDKYKQINKYIELLQPIFKQWDKNVTMHIADMGSGKGYLTFALYEYLREVLGLDVQMTGYELRKELTDYCQKTANELEYTGLKFQNASIDVVDSGKIDMLIALHACDTATDMAIAKGIESNAKFIVVSPCCHKQVRKAMSTAHLLNPITKHGIMEERIAEILTDGLRALIMENHGYKTQIMEFISSEHTSKNLLIIGAKTNKKNEAEQKINHLKSIFGIKEHYLEKLLSSKII